MPKKPTAKPRKRPAKAAKPRRRAAVSPKPARARKAPQRAARAPKVPARFRALGGVDPRTLPPGTPYPCSDGYVGAVVRGDKLAGRIVACATPPAGSRGQHYVLGKVASGRAISAEFRKGYKAAEKVAAAQRERARRDSIRTPEGPLPRAPQSVPRAEPSRQPQAATVGAWRPPTVEELRDPRRYMNEVATWAASLAAALDAGQRPGKWRIDFTPRLSSGRQFVSVNMGQSGIEYRVDKDGNIDYLDGSRRVPMSVGNLTAKRTPWYPKSLPQPLPLVIAITDEKAPGAVNAAARPARSAAEPEDRPVRAYVPTWAPSTVGPWKGIDALPMPKFKGGEYKGVGEVSKLVRAEVLKQVKARNLPDIEISTRTDRYSMGQSVAVEIVSLRGLSGSAFALRTDWRDGERIDELSAEGKAVVDSIRAIADQWNDRRSYYEPSGDYISNDTYHLEVEFNKGLRGTEVAVLRGDSPIVDLVLSWSIEARMYEVLKKAGVRGAPEVRAMMQGGPGAGYVVEVKTRKGAALQAEAMDPTDARNVAFALARELGVQV